MDEGRYRATVALKSYLLPSQIRGMRMAERMQNPALYTASRTPITLLSFDNYSEMLSKAKQAFYIRDEDILTIQFYVEDIELPEGKCLLTPENLHQLLCRTQRFKVWRVECRLFKVSLLEELDARLSMIERRS